MTTATHQKHVPTRAKIPRPVIDLMEKTKTLTAQGKSEAEIARELGVEPPLETHPPPRSRRNGRQEPTPDEPQCSAVVIRLSDVTQSPILWLWPGRIPLGKLTVLDGDPGLGKSLLSLDIAARVTTARPMPDGTRSDLQDSAGVLILSAEDELSDTIHPRLDAAGADLFRLAFLSRIRDRQGERFPLITDITDIRRELRRIDARLMIIDPLMAYLPNTVNSYRDQDIRSVLAPLVALVAEMNVALLVIRHLNKMVMQNPLYRGGGSIGIIGASRSGLLVAHDPNEPNPERHILVPTKANLDRLASALIYRTEETSTGALRITWEGPSPHTARTLLEQQGENDAHSATEEAKAFLIDLLRDGPVPAKEVRQESGQAGITSRTLDRAKSRLGIKARKMGQPGQRNQQWIWELSQAELPLQNVKNAEVRQL